MRVCLRLGFPRRYFNWLEHDPPDSLSRITCNKEDQPACKLEEFDPNIPVCANITNPENYEDFEANNCESYCASSDAEEDETKRCRFWRFVST